MHLGCLIYTYNKIEEAELQIELIRKIRTPYFEDIKIVHAYSGEELYIQGLEDKLIKIDNAGHFIGAANLMDVGVKTMLDNYDIDYILVTASDCRWMLPEKIVTICKDMRTANNVIATCVRGYPGQLDRRSRGLACDTFFIDARNERKHPIFPLNAQEFRDRNIDMLVYYRGAFKIEKLLMTRYVQSIMNYTSERDVVTICDKGIYHLRQRMPTIIGHMTQAKRNFDCPILGLYTNHDFEEKRKILKKLTGI